MDNKISLSMKKLWVVRAYDVYDENTMYEHKEPSNEVCTRYFESKEDAENFVKKHQDECDAKLDFDPYPNHYLTDDKGNVYECDGYILEHGKDDFHEEQNWNKMNEDDDDEYGIDMMIPDSCIEEEY